MSEAWSTCGGDCYHDGIAFEKKRIDEVCKEMAELAYEADQDAAKGDAVAGYCRGYRNAMYQALDMLRGNHD